MAQTGMQSFSLLFCFLLSSNSLILESRPCDMLSLNWRELVDQVNATKALESNATIGVVMQITDPIGHYASNFLATTAMWCEDKSLPLFIFGALPGCNETHPTPNQMDNRFGKVWILSNLLRDLIDDDSSLEWLLWIDSDVLILDEPNHSVNHQHLPNFISDLIEFYGRSSSSSSSSSSDINLIVADQRNSLEGDINAGTMLLRSTKWSVEFLNDWWNHEAAQRGEYEQRVFSALWAENKRAMRSHTALTPMYHMNSDPGVWWTDQSSPVLHLMQRSTAVRLAVGAEAVSRLCRGLSLYPRQQEARKGWVFSSSLEALFIASLDLLRFGPRSHHLGDCGRIFTDLLILITSQDFKTIELSSEEEEENDLNSNIPFLVSDDRTEYSMFTTYLKSCFKSTDKFQVLRCLLSNRDHFLEVAKKIIQLTGDFYHQASLLDLVASYEVSLQGGGDSSLYWKKAVFFRQQHARLLYRSTDPPAAQSELASAMVQHAKSLGRGGEPLFKTALKLKKDALSHGHSDVAMLLLDYAALLQDTSGRSEKCLELCLEALAILKSSVGPFHPWTAAALHRLGSLHLLQHSNDKAEKSYREALAIHRENELRELRWQQRHTTPQCAQQDQKDYEAVASSGGVEMAATLSALGDMLRGEAGREGEAIALLQKALTIFQNKFGAEHEKVALVHNNLGLAYQKNTEFLSESKAHLFKAIGIYQDLFGESHPQVAVIENNAAGTQWKQGDTVPARSLMIKAKQSLMRAYGPRHPLCRGIDWAIAAIDSDEACPL